MSEGTDVVTVSTPDAGEFDVEHTFGIHTGQWRAAMPFSEAAKVRFLRTLFAEVLLISLTAEVRQDNLIGTDPGDIQPKGHIYVGIIPSNMNTDANTGSAKGVVDSVPNKQTFPLSGDVQNNMIFKPNLLGYELDLAQDPRRGAGPVGWIGNSGVKKVGTDHVSVCTITWKMRVKCSGRSPLWF